MSTQGSLQSDRDFKAYCSSIARYSAVECDVRLRFWAVGTSNGFVLLSAQLIHAMVKSEADDRLLETDRLLVGNVAISSVADNVEQFWEDVNAGIINVKGHSIAIPKRHDGYSCYFQGLHQEGIKQQYRLSSLTVSGGKKTDFPSSGLEWYLMSLPTPYSTVLEVENEFGAALNTTETVTIEASFMNVAAITGDSKIVDDLAHIECRLAKGVDPKDIRLGYIVYSNTFHAAKRSSVEGVELSWSEDSGYKVGAAEIPMEGGSLLHGFISYKNLLQHHYWVNDPANIRNNRKAAYEAYDETLQTLRSVLDEMGQGRRDARRFEYLVSTIFWIIGFSSIPLDPLGLNDAVDIVVCSPRGEYMLIECTTDILKSGHKLPKLYERCRAFEQHLQATGHSSRRVLPVLVTSKSPEDVKPELSEAEKMGILVLGQPDIKDLLDTLDTLTNPDAAYDSMFDIMLQKRNAHESQVELQV